MSRDRSEIFKDDDARREADRRLVFWAAVSVTSASIVAIWAFVLPVSLKAQGGGWSPFTAGRGQSDGQVADEAKAAFRDLKTKLLEARAAVNGPQDATDDSLARLRARLEEEAQKNSTEPPQP